MAKNYFSLLGYIANVPSSVITAVIETAIERGYSYHGADHQGNFELVNVNIAATGMIGIVYVNNTTHETESVEFNGRNHTIDGSRTLFSVSDADYICCQILRLYHLHDRVFDNTVESSDTMISFPITVSEKILRSMIMTTGDGILKNYRKDTNIVIVDEVGENLIMLTTGLYNNRKVLYNTDTSKVEFPEEEPLALAACSICDCIKHRK